jgi:DNA/RNA endonuclease G (NUC1)/PKD repeat protein
MRSSPVRALRRAMLALVLVSCTSDKLTGPQAPGERAAVVASSSPLMITELMADPSAVSDANGEWFELYNGSGADVNLKGYRIASAAGATATETHTIATDVIVPAGGYVVIGNNPNTTTNGGVTLAYSYGTSIALNNGSSTSATEWLAIRPPLATSPATAPAIDSVAYAVRATPTSTPGAYVPPTGASRAVVSLDVDNTVISNNVAWSTSVTPYGAGDRGTPGESNFGGEAATVTVRATSFVTPGTSFTITAGAVDVDGKPSATTFSWTIADPSIATIDPATGRVTGVALGVTTVTATSANGISGTGTLFVVNPGDVASISISVNANQVPAGYTMPAFPTTRTTTNAVVTPALVWSSSDPSVATVNELGYITGVSPGSVTIRATAPNGVFGTVPFTIIPATAPTSAVYRNHIEFGAPVDVNSTGTILLTKAQYVESYDPARGGPRWVSWDLNKSQFGAAPRCDCFSADQTLPADVYHVVDFDYRNGGYDRGHMVQSESRTTTDQENAATFLLTNILPQAAANNQGPWSKLENELNDMARSTTAPKEIYVVAGGIYGASAPTLKGENKVAIPDYTWKVAVIMDAGKGLADVHSAADLQVIAVKMPNLTDANATSDSPAYAGTGTGATTIAGKPWQTYATTVDEIERITGYDLLSALPDNIERLVESTDRAPVAAVGGPYTGAEGTAVTLDASASSDPDAGDVLTYAWDFGDGETGTGATPAHVYHDDGTYTATVTVTDGTGVEATATTTVTISNVAPTAALVVPTSVNEGSPINLSLINAFDPSSVDMASLTFAFDCGDGSFGAPSSSATAVCPTTDNGTRLVRGRVTDKNGASNEYAGTVQILNVAPVITGIVSPTAPFALGGSATVSVSATDAGNDPLTTSVNWGDGQSGTALTHTYATAGVYAITVTVTDKDGGTVSSSNVPWIVVYDPAPWVNGSGWLMGPGGKTTFNSTVRYANGATKPSGDTQYAVNNGSFTFTATGYDWLVIANGRAQYMGQGTVAGRSGTVRFLVTELDGSTPDAIRLKVWDASGVIYDNAPGAEISSLATPISGGNINIHP